MFISKFDKEQFHPKFGTLVSKPCPWPTNAAPPFEAGWGIIKPRQEMEPHAHSEPEVYVVVSGTPEITVNGASESVHPGDIIYLPPFSKHMVSNPSSEHDALLLKIWWMPPLPAQPDIETAPLSGAALVVTSTPPTPNGDLHIGHLSGPYLAADVFTRYARSLGRQVWHLTGIDDHQSYVALKSIRMGISAVETAQTFGALMCKAWQNSRIFPDYIVRPQQTPDYVEHVQNTFRTLYELGAVVPKETHSLHCDACDRYLFEAWVHGKCPHCLSVSGGNACEVCGRPNDCSDLREPLCAVCGSAPAIRTTRRLYFRLSQYESQLRRYWETANMNAHLRALCKAMLADGLPDICVSHPSEWGIPVPLAEFAQQRIYVWFEMAPGYMYSLATAQKSWRATDSSGSRSISTETVQFFGFDNGYFHAVLFPAIHFAQPNAACLPESFVTNEFYRLEGQKISTSRGHAIWANEILSKFPADIVRFYLAYTAPELWQTNFEPLEFSATIKRELLNGMNIWFEELASASLHFNIAMAPSPGLWYPEQGSFYKLISNSLQTIGLTYDHRTFSLQGATRAICELVRSARQFLLSQRSFIGLDSAGPEHRTAYALALLAAKVIAVVASPVMPETAARIWNELGYETAVDQGGWKEILNWVPAGTLLGFTTTPLFAECIFETDLREYRSNHQ